MAKITTIDNGAAVEGSGINSDVSEQRMDTTESKVASSSDFGLDKLPLKGKPVIIDRKLLEDRRVYVDGDSKEAKIAISAYKNLRTRVMLKMNEINVSTLMVVGAAQNVGKTLTSINLALAIARRSEKKVILVDMDLRSPSLHNVLDFKSTGCILDIAEGKKTIQQVLVDPGIENLTIIPGSDRHEDSSEAIISSNMIALMNGLRNLPDTIVVYDTPPVLGCDDVAAVSPYMDAGLFVVSERDTSRKELADALGMLNDIELVGVTINRSSEGNFSSYYY